MPRYTSEVGRKFHPDGTPRQFPGITIICFVFAPLTRHAELASRKPVV